MILIVLLPRMHVFPKVLFGVVVVILRSQVLGQEIFSLPEKFDSALVGVGWRFHDGPLAVYDKNKVIGILDAEMGEEWGEEFF